HVPCQDGKNKEVPLIYVHEGKVRAGKRSKLKNPHYFTGVYRFRRTSPGRKVGSGVLKPPPYA
ncbi:MAG TPA: hypothetical protein GX735_03235, partial [Firmicutes bacterium]|nr:hypothetical protein [Bacillota bacterium]